MYCLLLATGMLAALTAGCREDPVKSLPVVTTLSVTNAGLSSAEGGGEVISDGGIYVSERGVCWSKNPDPAISDSRTADGWGLGAFSSAITGLAPETRYYARAYATNSDGTAYGSQVEFQTLPPYSGSVTDIDGNTYGTILIGDREWMAENLRTKRFSDGSPVPEVAVEAEWPLLTSPGYCWPNNDAALLGKTYGALYNGYAAGNPAICPEGWHLPTDAEWLALGSTLKGDPIERKKMKTAGTMEAGTGLWQSPNTGASNESRFSALPGGYRYGDRGKFEALNTKAFFWSSSADGKGGLFYRNLYHDNTDLYKSGSGSLKFGFSIRCIKNIP